ncbi:Serine/threonine-protein kinase PknL [compost metagenome]
MASKYIEKMIGKIVGGHTIIEHLGSGGNADVFKVMNRHEQHVAMKLLIVTKSRFEKKYARFKDEIKVVKKYHNVIPGIIPVLDMYLPDEPNSNDRPWYTMPIAEPLSKHSQRLENIDEVIKCVHDLSKVLIMLHEKEIVHRDIKPSNIYYYNNAWAFGDFGLVDYPEKLDLTEKGESVGPKNTIAPEMKRDAINADGKPADVYSLAKTLWILLAKEKDGFEGQYSHKIAAFNIDRRINIDRYRRRFTVTLHELIEKSTSNVPNERPNATEFFNVLSEWFELNRNYKKSNLLEWEFYIREIIPSTLPEKISWTNIEDIIDILKMVSHTNLNHLFFPRGGGMDLTDCSVSNEDGFIELNVGFTLKLKPKRLTLNTFKASFDWNYFYLETESIVHPLREEIFEDTKRFDTEIIEISPGNYVSYEDEKASQGRRLVLQLHGGLAIFSKGSFYNSISSTYDGRHSRGTPDDFRNYIQRSIDQINFDKENPEIARSRREANRKRREEKEKRERELYLEKLSLIQEKWDEKIVGITLPKPKEYNANSKLAYCMSFHSDILNDKYYYISKDRKLIHYATGWLEAIEKEDYYIENSLMFYEFDELVELTNYFEMYFEELESNSLDAPLMLNFDVEVRRLRKPENLFSRNDLRNLVKEATDESIVCIDADGNIHLKQNSELSRISKKQYPVISTQSYIENIQNEPREFETLFLSLLSAWQHHLNVNKSEIITDTDLEVFYAEDYDEHELLASIQTVSAKYPD